MGGLQFLFVVYLCSQASLSMNIPPKMSVSLPGLVSGKDEDDGSQDEQLETLNGTIHKLEEKVEQAQSDAREATTSFQNLKAKLSSIRDDLVSANTQANDMEKRVDDLQNRINELMSLKESMDVTQKKQAELEKRINQTQSALGVCSRLETQVSELQNKLSESTEKNKALESKLSTLNTSYTALETKITETQTKQEKDAQTLEAVKEQFNKQTRELTEKIVALETVTKSITEQSQNEEKEEVTDACASGKHECDENAVCYSRGTSYVCECNEDYQGNGKTCEAIDPCVSGTHECDVNAVCLSRGASYDCECHAGYKGDGKTCEAIDACANDKHECDVNAVCHSIGSTILCECNDGYVGDGKTCEDMYKDPFGAENVLYQDTGRPSPYTRGATAVLSSVSGAGTALDSFSYRG